MMSFTSQIMTGAVGTIKFFLSEAFLGQHFEAVELEANKPEPRELFLFRLLTPMGHWCRAHVGIYCSHGEIIHFMGRSPSGHGMHQFPGSWEGVVCKQGQRALQRSRQPWCVMWRRCGIDHVGLEHQVHEAMAIDPPAYHSTHYNCVHFVLSLLGLGLVDLDPTMD